jgi:hypothetical protein
MPTTVAPRPTHSACSASSKGISRRQGAHQVAQKLMIRDWPAKELMEVGLPLRSASEKTGSRSGTETPGVASGCAKSLGFAGLACPAGTGIPEGAAGGGREERTHAPAQMPKATSKMAPVTRSSGLFMPLEAGLACVPCAAKNLPGETRGRLPGWRCAPRGAGLRRAQKWC